MAQVKNNNISDKKDAPNIQTQSERQMNNGFQSYVKFADQINEDLFAFVCLEN